MDQAMKYGDDDNVKRDVDSLNEILERQGNSFFIDVIAEHAGRVATKFSLNDENRKQLTDSLVNEFRAAILERV